MSFLAERIKERQTLRRERKLKGSETERQKKEKELKKWQDDLEAREAQVSAVLTLLGKQGNKQDKSSSTKERQRGLVNSMTAGMASVGKKLAPKGMKLPDDAVRNRHLYLPNQEKKKARLF